MTDIPPEFADVPRLKDGRPDFRTRRGKELKAHMDAQGPEKPAEGPSQPQTPDMVPQEPESPPEGLKMASRAIPALGSKESAALLLEWVAETWPNARYIDWKNVQTMQRRAQGNLLHWRRLTKGR